MWNRLFENLKQFITKEWNELFEKCAIEIGVIFSKEASEKWTVGSELWTSKHGKWNTLFTFSNNKFQNRIL